MGGDPADLDADVEQLMLQDAIGQNYSIQDRGQTAVRINNEISSRVMIESRQWEKIVRPKNDEANLRENQRVEAGVLQMRKASSLTKKGVNRYKDK